MTNTAIDETARILDKIIGGDHSWETINNLLGSIEQTVLSDGTIEAEVFLRRVEALRYAVTRSSKTARLAHSSLKSRVLDSTVKLLADVKTAAESNGPLRVVLTVNDFWVPYWGEA